MVREVATAAPSTLLASPKGCDRPNLLPDMTGRSQLLRFAVCTRRVQAAPFHLCDRAPPKR